jgi:hypothetical protein
MERSTHAAARRAAQAALTRPSQDEDFDRYLVINDSDDDFSTIFCVLRERSPRGLEVLS